MTDFIIRCEMAQYEQEFLMGESPSPPDGAPPAEDPPPVKEPSDG